MEIDAGNLENVMFQWKLASGRFPDKSARITTAKSRRGKFLAAFVNKTGN